MAFFWRTSSQSQPPEGPLQQCLSDPEASKHLLKALSNCGASVVDWLNITVTCVAAWQRLAPDDVLWRTIYCESDPLVTPQVRRRIESPTYCHKVLQSGSCGVHVESSPTAAAAAHIDADAPSQPQRTGQQESQLPSQSQLQSPDLYHILYRQHRTRQQHDEADRQAAARRALPPHPPHVPLALAPRLAGCSQWMRCCARLFMKPRVVLVLSGRDPVVVRRLGGSTAAAAAADAPASSSSGAGAGAGAGVGGAPAPQLQAAAAAVARLAVSPYHSKKSAVDIKESDATAALDATLAAATSSHQQQQQQQGANGGNGGGSGGPTAGGQGASPTAHAGSSGGSNGGSSVADNHPPGGGGGGGGGGGPVLAGGEELVWLGINYHLEDRLDEDEERFSLEFPQLFQDLDVGDIVVTADYRGAGCWSVLPADPTCNSTRPLELVLRKNVHDPSGFGVLPAVAGPPSFPLLYYTEIAHPLHPAGASSRAAVAAAGTRPLGGAALAEGGVSRERQQQQQQAAGITPSAIMQTSGAIRDQGAAGGGGSGQQQQVQRPASHPLADVDADEDSEDHQHAAEQRKGRRSFWRIRLWPRRRKTSEQAAGEGSSSSSSSDINDDEDEPPKIFAPKPGQGQGGDSQQPGGDSNRPRMPLPLPLALAQQLLAPPSASGGSKSQSQQQQGGGGSNNGGTGLGGELAGPGGGTGGSGGAGGQQQGAHGPGGAGGGGNEFACYWWSYVTLWDESLFDFREGDLVED